MLRHRARHDGWARHDGRLTEILSEKLEIELRYVREWSVGGDLWILARTFTGLLS